MSRQPHGLILIVLTISKFFESLATVSRIFFHCVAWPTVGMSKLPIFPWHLTCAQLVLLFVCIWFKPNTDAPPHSNHHHHSSMGWWLCFVGQGVGRRKMVSSFPLTTAMFSHQFFLPFLQEKSLYPHQPTSLLWCSTWDCKHNGVEVGNTP